MEIRTLSGDSWATGSRSAASALLFPYMRSLPLTGLTQMGSSSSASCAGDRSTDLGAEEAVVPHSSQVKDLFWKSAVLRHRRDRRQWPSPHHSCPHCHSVCSSPPCCPGNPGASGTTLSTSVLVSGLADQPHHTALLRSSSSAK